MCVGIVSEEYSGSARYTPQAPNAKDTTSHRPPHLTRGFSHGRVQSSNYTVLARPQEDRLVQREKKVIFLRLDPD